MGRRELFLHWVLGVCSFVVLRGQVQHQHVMIYTSILTGDGDPTRRPTFAELNGTLYSLIASRALLIEDGATAQRTPAGGGGGNSRSLPHIHDKRWREMIRVYTFARATSNTIETYHRSFEPSNFGFKIKVSRLSPLARQSLLAYRSRVALRRREWFYFRHLYILTLSPKCASIIAALP
jgi:hypothetical protein